MPLTIDGPPSGGERKRPLWKKLAWFFGLGLGGLAATALVAYAMRAVLLA